MRDIGVAEVAPDRFEILSAGCEVVTLHKRSGRYGLLASFSGAVRGSARDGAEIVSVELPDLRVR